MGRRALVSVIVPVYNVEYYLEACVESLQQQTYQDIEILLINDGSTDGSEEVCRKILQKDSRVKYFEKKNSGLSDTRNVGIEHASGQFIMFLDSDDLVAPNTIEYLYQLLEKYNVELSSLDLVHFTDGEKPVYKEASSECVFHSEDATCSFLYQKEISTSACGKLFSKKLFSDVRFPSGMLFEDNVVLYKILSSEISVVYGDAKYYGYRHRANSITTKKFSKKDLDILDIGREIVGYFRNQSNKLQRATEAYHCSNCLRVYLNAPDTTEFQSAIQESRLYLDRYAKFVVKDPGARRKLRMALLLYNLRIPRKMFISIYSRIGRWK